MGGKSLFKIHLTVSLFSFDLFNLIFYFLSLKGLKRKDYLVIFHLYFVNKF